MERMVVLLPELARRLAPSDSISSAMSAEEREVVPMVRRVLWRRLMPLVAGVSEGRPVWKAACR